MRWPAERCGCGAPLHYVDPVAEAQVRRFVELYGETVVVKVGGEAYHVPRHYIALHGLSASRVSELASRYGWAPA